MPPGATEIRALLRSAVALPADRFKSSAKTFVLGRGAARHAKTGFCSAKTAGVGFFPKIVTIRTPRAFLALLQTAPNGRASRRHPLRREVPLGTRRLEFAQTSPRAATRFWTKTASGHHISQPNELWPRAWAEFSPWRPVASPRDGSATFASLICARAGDGPKNCSTQWSLAARLGKSFPINSPFIGLISLLRRGARWFERTGLKPAGLRLRRGGAPIGRSTGHPGEKTVFVRAPGEILPFQLFVETVYFPFKARRAHPQGVLLACRVQTSSTALKLRSPLTKAERTPTKHPTGAPRRRAHRASYWPFG